jgi:glucose dehydrogenase
MQDGPVHHQPAAPMSNVTAKPRIKVRSKTERPRLHKVILVNARKLITHSARNGHLYTMDRHNGQIIGAEPYTDVNWTRGIDQKTGKPVEYDPGKDIQTYAGVGNLTPGEPLKRVCPSILGGKTIGPARTIRGPSSSISRQ